MSNEVYETVAKTFFKFAKTAINVQRNKLKKNFPIKKLFFEDSEWTFSYFQRKSSPELSKLHPT